MFVGYVYTLAALEGAEWVVAVFNDSSNPNFVGYLTGVDGLDSAEVRTSGDDYAEADGGYNGPAYFGRRPIIFEGILPQSTETIRQARIEKLERIGRIAMRQDAYMSWTPADGITRAIAFRRNGRWPITGLVDKRFIAPMIAASHLIESNSAFTLNDAAAPLSVAPNNAGNAVALPVVKVYNTSGVALVSPINIAIDGTTVLRLSYALPAGRRADIDFNARTAKTDTGTNLYRYIDFGVTQWAKGIPPGAHTVTSDKGTALDVIYRHSWT